MKKSISVYTVYRMLHGALLLIEIIDGLAKKRFAPGQLKKQVLEAVEAGIEMGGGPATVAAGFAMTVMEYYRQ